MLGKLMKHEFIASYRIYLPVYLALYVLSLLIFFSYRVNGDIISSLLLGVFFLLEGAVAVFIIYNLIVSLGVRVYGKPGYLLFSVPAKTHEIMLAKYIVNFIWIVASVFVSITALAISFSMLGILGTVSELLSYLWLSLNLTGLNVVMLIVFIIVLISYYIAFFMFLFALLNLIYKGERKILIGTLLYFALSFAIKNIISVFSLSVVGAFSGENITFGSIWFIILIYFVVSAGLVVLSYIFMNKKMELQ